MVFCIFSTSLNFLVVWVDFQVTSVTLGSPDELTHFMFLESLGFCLEESLSFVAGMKKIRISTFAAP